MAGKVSQVFTGEEVPDVVRKAKDWTVDAEFRRAVEEMYRLGVRCSEIEKAFGWKAGCLGYGCDLGLINLQEPAEGSRTRGKGFELLKAWSK